MAYPDEAAAAHRTYRTAIRAAQSEFDRRRRDTAKYDGAHLAFKKAAVAAGDRRHAALVIAARARDKALEHAAD